MIGVSVSPYLDDVNGTPSDHVHPPVCSCMKSRDNGLLSLLSVLPLGSNDYSLSVMAVSSN